MSSSDEGLVRMINDIAAYFAADPDHDAGVEGVLTHIQRFWEPRMRTKLCAHVAAHGDAALSPLARDAVGRLAQLGVRE